MITYPNNNVQSIGDQTSGRVVLIDNPTALTPRKLFSYIKEGFIPVAATVSSGVTSFAFCSFSGFPSEEAEEYTLTVGSTSYTATPVTESGVVVLKAFDAEFAAA